jgi:copper chaperone NosL
MKPNLLKSVRALSLFAVVLFYGSCGAQPQPIQYGSDQCDLCRMAIIDERYGAELVTRKGKIHKFDSGECMINYIRHGLVKEKDIASIWVVSPAQPRKLIDASKAHYLHSEKFPSPMGADLSAFETEAELRQYLEQYGGEAWTWEQAMKNVK